MLICMCQWDGGWSDRLLKLDRKPLSLASLASSPNRGAKGDADSHAIVRDGSE